MGDTSEIGMIYYLIFLQNNGQVDEEDRYETRLTMSRSLMKLSEPFSMLFLYIAKVFHDERLKEVPLAMMLRVDGGGVGSGGGGGESGSS